MASTVLVTGVARRDGAHFARRLAGTPGVARVIGVDVHEPHHALGRAEFVRADIRNPLVSRVMAQTGVDTVVHMSVGAERSGAGAARATQKERNVIGTMQLLAAAQGRQSVTRIVLRSTDSVYGSSSADPAFFSEDMGPRARARSGFVREAIEVEGYVRGVTRRRPDISLCILRMAHVVGPKVDSSLAEYLRGPVVPSPFGYDARLQLLHEDDEIGALVAATTGEATGVFNIAGDGIITFNQAIRMLGRPTVPVFTTTGRRLGAVARRVGLIGLSDDEIDYLLWGRCVDTTRMREQLGYEPAWTTRTAFEDFAEPLPRVLPRPGDVATWVESLTRTTIGGRS